MARIRSIKPEFFINDEMADLDPLTRLFYIGLWTQADREGRMYDRPKRLKVSIMPYDACDPDAMLETLSENGHIIRYKVDGKGYIQVVNFLKHQMPHYKEVPSVLPAPDGHTDSPVVATPLTQVQRDAVFERAGEVCVECGSTDDLTIDHIIPKSLGGTNDDENLRVLCRRCNSAKNNRASAQRQAEVGATMTSGREGSGLRKGEGTGEEEETAATSVAKPLPAFATLPDCMEADTVTPPKEYAFIGRHKLGASLIGYASWRWPETFKGPTTRPEDLNAFRAAITDGCFKECPQSKKQREHCYTTIREAITDPRMEGTTWPKKRALFRRIIATTDERGDRQWQGA